MSAQEPLSARNAEITTVTVEIRTVQVSGKQMTQSVFRQLIEESLISYDGSLNGEPWGSVNYHPGSGCDYHDGSDHCYAGHGDHLHVVWQRGGELRRDTVSERTWCGDPERTYQGPLADRVIQAAFCMAGHQGLPGWVEAERDPRAEFLSHGAPQYRAVTFGCAGVTCKTGGMPEAPWTPGTPGSYPAPDPAPWAQRAPLRHQQCLTAADFAAASAAIEAEAATVNARADAEQVRRSAYAGTWQELTQLPQLFIAV